MEKADPSIPGKMKRSRESSDDDNETLASTSKKSKAEYIKNASTDEQENQSQPLPQLKSDEESTDKNSDCRKASKRPKEALSDCSHPVSPSKKRKTVQIQVDREQISDSQYQGREDMDKKKKRLKKKALLKAVLEQMEFYFSDSNLSKDRFMRKLYDCSDDGYISLAVFNNFNKLQALDKEGVPTEIVCRALARSELLEVSEDQTKVRRLSPLVNLDQEEVDQRTVYVEHLPEHASHTWLQKIFSQCGKVNYVSLPKYQTTKEIKGFAFVEFSSAEEAGKACSMLNNPPPAKTEEKPGKFPKWNKTLRGLHRSAPAAKIEERDSNEENIQSDSGKEDAPTPSPAKKRKKNSLKKGGDEGMNKGSTAEAQKPQDERKKKKKKKKKPTLGSDGGDKEKDGMAKTLNTDVDDQDTKPIKSEASKDSAEEGKERKGGMEEKSVKKKKKKKKKKKVDELSAVQKTDSDTRKKFQTSEKEKTETGTVVGEEAEKNMIISDCKDAEHGEKATDVKLSRKERKLLRQEDIRRKKAERVSKANEEGDELKQSNSTTALSAEESGAASKSSRVHRERLDSLVSESSETDSPSKVYIKSDGSQVTSILAKSRKQDVVKRVEFDPVPITTEFIERKEIRRRKKQKRDSLHLRVLSKKEWLGLRAEYIQKQKSHMTALKESLRELRMQENQGQMQAENNSKTHVDLTNVFGVKRMKPSQDVKLAHVEELKFIPNVIVQWKCSHEIKRNKIKTMFQEISSDCIAYIEGKEEAKSGFIRFKDEVSAEEFARLSRTSDSFSARVLPESQQAAYWEKANKDRIAKLSQKKNERGSDKIARKVFERNKATFQEKGSHTVFDEDEEGDEEKVDDSGQEKGEVKVAE